MSSSNVTGGNNYREISKVEEVDDEHDSNLKSDSFMKNTDSRGLP